MQEYRLQEINLPKEWKVQRNVFTEVSPTSQILEDDKYMELYGQEDLFYFTFKDYHLDLGWYGGDDFSNPFCGYMLVLLRGEHWHNCELLELTRTKSIDKILEKIKEIFEAVSKDYFKDKKGFIVNEDENENYIGEHFQFSVLHGIDLLISTLEK